MASVIEEYMLGQAACHSLDDLGMQSLIGFGVASSAGVSRHKEPKRAVA